MVTQGNNRTISYSLSKGCLNLQVQSRKKEEGQGQHRGKSHLAGWSRDKLMNSTEESQVIN